MATKWTTPSLPEPQGSLLEISFRRLLESCIKQLEDIELAAAAAAAGGAAAVSGKDTDAPADGSSSSIRSAGGGASGADGNRKGSAGGDSFAAAYAEAGPPSWGGSVRGPGGGSAGGKAGGVPGSSESDRAASVLKMRHFIDTLREHLTDLRAQQEALGIDAATLDLYDTHVKAVAAAVPKVQLPSYCQKLVAGGAAAAAAAASGGAASSRPAPGLSYFTPPPTRPGLATTGAAAGRDADGTPGNGTGATAGLSDAAAVRLREAEAAQALLTDELAELTAALKANASGMAGAVADRGRLLDATESALGDSLAATQRNAAAAKAQVKRSGGNLCFTCMVLLLVGLVFTSMVVYIKFTHLLGYRAVSSSAWVPSGAKAWLGGGEGGQGGGGSAGWREAHGDGVGDAGGFGERDPWDRGGEL